MAHATHASTAEPADVFRLAFDAAPIGMALVAPDGRWLRVNRSLCALTGYSEPELLQGRFQDITHPDDLDADLELVREMLAGERQSYQMDKRYVRKDGAIAWVSLSISIARVGPEGPTVFVSQIEDITERRRMLSELEQRGRLMDLAHDAIIVRDASDGTVTYWNRRAEQLYGYSAAHARGRITHELLRTEFPESRDAVDATLQDRGRWEGELSHIRADGRRIVVSSRQALQRDARGAPRAVIELNSDITEQRRAERALSEAEDRHRLIIETLAEGVVLFDERGRNVQMNPAAARMIGMPSEEATGAHAADPRWRMVHEDGSEFAAEELPAEVTRLTGTPQTGVVMGMRSPDGALRWLLVDTRIVDPASGPPFRVVASFDDITSLKRAEHEAQQRLSELARAAGEDITVLEALVAQSNAGLAFFDCALRFAHVNDALAAINGLPVEAHIGHTMSELFGSEAEETQRLIASVRDSGAPLTDHELISPPPWNNTSFRVSYWPVRGRGGELLGVSAMVVDITADKEAARERERLLGRERRAADRVRRLQRVTAALAGAISVGDVVDVVVREATAAANMSRGWIALMSTDRARLEVAATTGLSGEEVVAYRRLATDAHSPAPDVIRSGRAQYFTSADEQSRAYPELADAFRAGDHEAGAVIPIPGGDRPLGVIALTSAERREFDLDDRALLETIARQCAQALERARLYERERATAQTLTRSLLPARLPDIPGVALGHRYAPTPLLRSAVGGDFYDVVPLDADSWLLVVGDVAGKGPDAAALTGLVRYTLRAEARHDHRPERLLSVLNEAILDQRGDGRFCTLACARLDLASQGEEIIDVSTAGHPPPLLLGADGSAQIITTPGQLLGVFRGAAYVSQRLRFMSRSTLVLYTDGLLDAAAPEREVSPEDLGRQLVRDPESDPQALIDGLYERAVGHQPAPRDDIAILAARLTV